MCDLVNDPSFDQLFNGAGFAPQQGFAGEMITVSTGPPTVGTPTATELQVNGAVVTSGGLPATLSYTLPADGQYYSLGFEFENPSDEALTFILDYAGAVGIKSDRLIVSPAQ